MKWFQKLLERFRPEQELVSAYIPEGDGFMFPKQAQPTPQPEPRMFDYEPYMRHMDDPHDIPQPPKDIADLIWDEFPEDATRSAIGAWSESGFNPKAMGTNTTGRLAGTNDKGLWQVNAGTPNDPSQVTTFQDLMNRKGGMMRAAGAHTQNDLFDPKVNAGVSRINLEESPQAWWGRWYGPRDKGFLKEDFNKHQSPY